VRDRAREGWWRAGEGKASHIGFDCVARHAVLGVFDRLVQAPAVLLDDAIQCDLVCHGSAHRSPRTESLGHVVPKVVVSACEVREDGIEVARFLHAISNGSQLIGKVLAPSLRRVEVRLDRHSDSATHDAVAMAPGTSVCVCVLTNGIEGWLL
jgi:hypothetical protein